ncbi:MAG: hypothetical protein HYX46_00050 [Betaproteobacteria bacterium]|nr:hypothetical protein [Betaproteobacteria bacterium]
MTATQAMLSAELLADVVLAGVGGDEKETNGRVLHLEGRRDPDYKRRGLRTGTDPAATAAANMVVRVRFSIADFPRRRVGDSPRDI